MIGSDLFSKLYGGEIKYVSLEGAGYSHPERFTAALYESIKFHGELPDLLEHPDMFSKENIKAIPPYPSCYFEFDDKWEEADKKSKVSFLLRQEEWASKELLIDIDMFMCDVEGEWRKVPVFMSVDSNGIDAAINVEWAHPDWKRMDIGVGLQNESFPLSEYVESCSQGLFCVGSLTLTLY